jgi:hypothetical protein
VIGGPVQFHHRCHPRCPLPGTRGREPLRGSAPTARGHHQNIWPAITVSGPHAALRKHSHGHIAYFHNKSRVSSLPAIPARRAVRTRQLTAQRSRTHPRQLRSRKPHPHLKELFRPRVIVEAVQLAPKSLIAGPPLSPTGDTRPRTPAGPQRLQLPHQSSTRSRLRRVESENPFGAASSPRYMPIGQSGSSRPLTLSARGKLGGPDDSSARGAFPVAC